MRKRFNRKWLIPIVIVLGIGIFFLPPVYSRLLPRIENLQSSIKYLIKPPDEAVFQPVGQSPTETVVSGTSSTQSPSPAPSRTPTPTKGPTLTPTITSTPLPASVDLHGDRFYVDQFERWNYCGPANLTMALKFWGWTGTRDDIAKVIKPGENDPKKDFIQRGKTDRNVMPYEMADFVQGYTDYNVVIRHGGNMDLMKSLIAAGFPVVIEKGYYERDYSGKTAWLGHYSFITGYDDNKHNFIYQEAYPVNPATGEKLSGKNWLVSYDHLLEGWRSFNYLFIVIYPPDRETSVFALLGPWADSNWADQHALEIANREIGEFAGQGNNNEFFAWYNKGTSLVRLQQYDQSAAAYDKAFHIYAALGETDKQRPYRIMWYQTWAYWAYFYTGRYQDVINLANTTLDTVAPPTLEESIYWRGRAEYMIGDTKSAVDDFREALRLHPNWGPAIQALQDLGIQP